MEPREDTFGQYERRTLAGARYADRKDAGRQLAEQLTQHRGRNALVLGMPRGGVPVAAEVAAQLDADLDVIVARKLGAPGQPELAIGAVTASGVCFLNEALLRLSRTTEPYLQRVLAEESAEARRREQRFRGGMPKLDLAGRTVILVDDGLATGATVHAAIRALRHEKVGRLVVAVPVGSPEGCQSLEDEVDEFVCPFRPEPFFAVGAHYADFSQTSDEEVDQLLRSRRQARSH